ncbi:ABC transporter ATP-binding protein [Halomarina oriensis]|uniref:Probable branched-chain amino acid transport ATP-binding protein LivG n=1 Tax=Halomarina oriensis TaxID=671145 RepID=A0A6B0GMF1_9EURY|nr:ABC transporter ATP-binding protein [Halomarina oriensis]MWG36086.1 ATP-binding cassette domain-containing protein [Halomarina oriensis]
MSDTEEQPVETSGETGESGDAPEPGTADSAVEEAAKTTPRGVPLRIQNLRKEFGGITAVADASFQVEAGSLTGLIGPNGAGKSTTFNCIAGVHRPTSGKVFFQGEDITGLRPEQVANKGLVRTFQIAREMEDMTVLENMMLAPRGQVGESLFNSVVPGIPAPRFLDDSQRQRWERVVPQGRRAVTRQEEDLRERAWETLEFFEIDHLAGEYAGSLSGGQRKLLEMARVLMTDPEMVLLDEPLAGVNPTLEKKLLKRVHDLREEGLTFLLVEHDMDVIMNNCEHIIVMHQGTVLAEGEADDIRNDDRVIDAYLGETI